MPHLPGSVPPLPLHLHTNHLCCSLPTLLESPLKLGLHLQEQLLLLEVGVFGLLQGLLQLFVLLLQLGLVHPFALALESCYLLLELLHPLCFRALLIQMVTTAVSLCLSRLASSSLWVQVVSIFTEAGKTFRSEGQQCEFMLLPYDSKVSVMLLSRSGQGVEYSSSGEEESLLSSSMSSGRSVSSLCSCGKTAQPQLILSQLLCPQQKLTDIKLNRVPVINLTAEQRVCIRDPLVTVS
ncbi:hypothetical protein INR49_010945 [Caranx melampygus]|nr:hypothetical protein INR49_010945 [Caranx melampygus]